MPDSFIPYGSDPATVGRRTATVKRTETRDTVAADYHRDEVIPVNRRVTSFAGVGSTFRIPGAAATPQNLFTIENTTGSAVLVALRSLQISMHQSAASLVLPPWFSLTRITTMPTGGTAFTKTALDSGDGLTSAANVTLRGAASADGTASAITATAAGQRLAQGTAIQLYTAAGHSGFTGELQMLSHVPSDMVLVLRPAQAYLLQVITAAAADNIAGRSFHVQAAWEEFTYM